MPTEVLTMYGAITGGTQDAIGSLDIPEDGFITGIDWAMAVNMDADDEHCVCELSFAASGQVSTNDVRGPLSHIRTRMSLVTSGIALSQINKFVMFDELRVAGGERIHLNVSADAGVTGDVNAQIHLNTSRQRPRRSARRR